MRPERQTSVKGDCEDGCEEEAQGAQAPHEWHKTPRDNTCNEEESKNPGYSAKDRQESLETPRSDRRESYTLRRPSFFEALDGLFDLLDPLFSGYRYVS